MKTLALYELTWTSGDRNLGICFGDNLVELERIERESGEILATAYQHVVAVTRRLDVVTGDQPVVRQVDYLG